MTKKKICAHTAPMDNFISSPEDELAKGDGDAIAVSSNNEVQFYVLPVELYEDMVNFVEYSQRGTTEHKPVPGDFLLNEKKAEEITSSTAEDLKNENYDKDDYSEC